MKPQKLAASKKKKKKKISDAHVLMTCHRLAEPANPDFHVFVTLQIMKEGTRPGDDWAEQMKDPPLAEPACP